MKKVTIDKEAAGLSIAKDCVCLLTLRLTEHTGGCPGCAALASHDGRATKLHNDEGREYIRMIIERTLTGMAMVNAYKDRISESSE